MPYDQNSVDQIFQQTLGRAGTPQEHQFLQPYVDQGFISPAQIGQYLQGTPEAQQGRLQGQQQQYGNLLTQNNSQILNQAAQAANGSFAAMGRQYSSGQGNAVIQAGQQLAAQQSPMLADFYGQGQNSLNNNYNNFGMSQLSRAYGLQDQTTQRRWDNADWQRQADYNSNALNTQNRQNLQNGLWGALASLPGQALGAAAQYYKPVPGKG